MKKISGRFVFFAFAIIGSVWLLSAVQNFHTKQIELRLSDFSAWKISRFVLEDIEGFEDSDNYREVPFVSFAEDDVFELYLNGELKSRVIGENLQVDFPVPGVPIDLKVIDGVLHFAFREIFGDKLFLFLYEPKKNILIKEEQAFKDIDTPIFRASSVVDGILYWVVYDNIRRKNYLVSVTGGENIMVELPTFWPPAGSTYEMEPPVYIFGMESEIYILAGASYIKIKEGIVESQRLDGCETVVEGVLLPTQKYALCRTVPEKDSPYQLMDLVSKKNVSIDMSRGVPWGLSYDKDSNAVLLNYATTSNDLAELFLYDLKRGQQSGLLELGINNTEGRIPWSQIYYLNGFMDALLLAREHVSANKIFNELAKDIYKRLTMEIDILDRLLDTEFGYSTKGFTHDRSDALFAVQTSRLLLLFDRYQEEFPGGLVLQNVEKLRKMVSALDDHIEIISFEGEDEKWMKKGTAHLRWPKCSAFYFDGMSVPFNHQNEWAYSLFNSARIMQEDINEVWLDAPKDIVKFFLDTVGVAGGFPPVEQWYYWYGHAYDGWTIADERSCNMPEYPGDRGLAWISFRTIDLMSILSSLNYVPSFDNKKIIDTAQHLLRKGDVYPFAARSLLEVGHYPVVEIKALERYYRAVAPWEISNSPWAIALGASSYSYD